MGDVIQFPPNMDQDQQIEFLRQELIKRNIDPDSIYPISIEGVDDSSDGIDDAGRLNLSMTMRYDHYMPEGKSTGQFEPQRDYGDETIYAEDTIQYRSVEEALEEWRRACTESVNK